MNSAIMKQSVLALMLLLLPVTLKATDQLSPSRLVTLDWTLAETLLAIGVQPLGIAEIAGYRSWVETPVMPDQVMELGLRTQPNLERLAQLKPEQILISRMFVSLKPRLSGIAPVEAIDIYTGGNTWEAMLAATREVGRIAKRPQAAEELIEDTQQRLASLGSQIQDRKTPLLVIQFMDAQHVRVFGNYSLYNNVLEQLGLRNAWPGKTNSWGFALINLRQLADIDARLLVIEPLPAGTREQLENSGLWQAMRSVQRGDVLYLPPVWSFGALPSARRFADFLVPTLNTPPELAAR